MKFEDFEKKVKGSLEKAFDEVIEMAAASNNDGDFKKAAEVSKKEILEGLGSINALTLAVTLLFEKLEIDENAVEVLTKENYEACKKNLIESFKQDGLI